MKISNAIFDELVYPGNDAAAERLLRATAIALDATYAALSSPARLAQCEQCGCNLSKPSGYCEDCQAVQDGEVEKQEFEPMESHHAGDDENLSREELNRGL
jgi:hypothetical protein